MKYLETIKIVDGHAPYLKYHLKRMQKAAKKDFNFELKAPTEGVYKARVIYEEEIEKIEYHPYTVPTIKSLQIVRDDTIEYPFKYADRKNIEELMKMKKTSDDILIIKNKVITDTSIANIAFYDGSKWLTPQNPLLQGTTRERLLEEKKIFAMQLYENDIKNFEKFALMNAMIGFLKIQDGIIHPC